MKVEDQELRIEKSHKIDILILMIIVGMHAVISFVLCDTDKLLGTYGDELIYYSIAKSLFNEKTIELHGASFSFQKILFSLYLLPFMGISNGIMRTKIILISNSVVTSLSLIPTWLLCKELGVKRKYAWLTMLIVFAWPDMLFAGTFMSEVIYWPLSVTAMYFCVKSIGAKSKNKYTILAAVFCYLCYFCKEVGLCIALAFMASRGLIVIINIFGANKNRQMKDIGGEIKRVLLFLGMFALLHVVVNYLFFGGQDNYYVKNGQMGIEALLKPYNMNYFVYGIVYYIVSTGIAFCLYPIVIPFLSIQNLNKQIKEVFVFSVILLFGFFVVICYTITIREDLGHIIPRIHLRYYSSIICILLPLCYRELERQENCKNSERCIREWIFIVIVILLVYRGAGSASFAENLSLQYTRFFDGKYTPIYGSGNDDIVFYPAVLPVYIGVILLAISAIFLNGKRILAYLFCGVSVIIGISNIVLAKPYYYAFYRGNDKAIKEMVAIDEYMLKNNSLNKNVLYVTKGWLSMEARVYDTYFDGTNSCEIEQHTFDEMVVDYKNTKVEEIPIYEAIWTRQYDVDSIDYIIVDAEYILPSQDGMVELQQLSGEYYKVYENIHPDIFMFSNEK